jgi:transitional endoplasmic reticulum ATPase
MSSINIELKRRHEGEAVLALTEQRLPDAFAHCLEAARVGYNLADMAAEAVIAEAYVLDAEGLVHQAERIQAKLRMPRAAPALSTDDGEGGKPAEEPGWRLRERPKVRLADVAGMQDLKAILEEDVIKPALHPEAYARYRIKPGGGVLMYGPPGVGKTHIAKAIAGELDATFFNVDPAQIKSKWVGEAEKNLSRLFEAARAEKRAVIFFDEVDALLGRSGNQKVNVITQFLMLSDGITASNGENEMLLLLAATNKPWLLDPAVRRPGRLGKQVYVGLPDDEARAAIVAGAFRGLPVEEGFSYPAAAARSEGFSGADLNLACNDTAKRAVAREIATTRTQMIRWSDFDAVVSGMAPSVSAADIEKFHAWAKGTAPQAGGEE